MCTRTCVPFFGYLVRYVLDVDRVNVCAIYGSTTMYDDLDVGVVARCERTAQTLKHTHTHRTYSHKGAVLTLLRSLVSWS